MMTKVALITGGASGMGLAVAQALVRQGKWTVHLVDLNAEAGEKAAAALGSSARFHKTDVTSYASLSSTFQKVYDTANRLDFVFANAGVVERFNFYARHGDGKSSAPPPEPDHISVTVDLNSVINTAYLALHYFRLSAPTVSDSSLIMTASCGGVYSTQSSPLYSSAKNGVVGLLRSISAPFYENDGVRVNAICPGPVRTGLVDNGVWDSMAQEMFTPLETVAHVVTTLVDGGELQDAKGKGVSGQAEDWGNLVELSGKNFFFRDRPAYCDEVMERIIKGTETTSEAGKNMII